MNKKKENGLRDMQKRHDISDDMWAKISPILPGQKGQWGGVAYNNRRFINAVFWILRTGAPWRDLPTSYGKWGTVHQRFRRWRDKGIWEKLLEQVIEDPGLGARGGNQEMSRTKGGSTPKYI